MAKSRTPQIFFVLAALTLAAGTGATIFQWSEIGDKWDKLAELKKNVRDPKDIQSEFDETSEKVTTSKLELEHLEKGVPAFAYVPTMLKELETFGKQNGIEVLGIRPIPRAETKDKNGKKKKEAYEEIAIEVKGRGQYKAVQSFVTALEKFPKIISARSISLAPNSAPQSFGPQNPAATGGKKLDVTLELRAFLFAPNKEEEKSATELAVQTSQTSPTSQTRQTVPAGPNSEKGNSAPVAATEVKATPKPAAKPAVSVAAKPAAKPALRAAKKSNARKHFVRRRARR